MRNKNTLFNNVFLKIYFMARFLTRSDFFCFLIIVYMFIIIVGTIEQKNFGLEYVQKIYFDSNFTFLFNVVPFLGGKLILFFVFASLFLRLFFDKWKKKRAGTILLHIGVLFLLLGAFVSSNYCIEGKIIIKENEYSNFFLRNDLYDMKLMNKKTGEIVVKSVCINKKSNNIFNINDADIFMSTFNGNCKLINRNKFLTSNEVDGIGRFFIIDEFPSFVEQEENKVNFFLKIKSNNYVKNIYLLFDSYKTINYDDTYVSISLEKRKEYLPFNLFLSKFEKISYYDTDKAKNYISNLIIESSDGITWKNKLEMNKPLRINNYTFYQTSYIDNSFEKMTILTVVKNSWSFYPYLSIFLIFFGFLLHLITSFNKVLRAKE